MVPQFALNPTQICRCLLFCVTSNSVFSRSAGADVVRKSDAVPRKSHEAATVLKIFGITWKILEGAFGSDVPYLLVSLLHGFAWYTTLAYEFLVKLIDAQ